MNSFYYKITCSQFPQISLAGHVRITPPYVHTRRRPDEYILYFILDGEMFLEEKNDTESNSYHLVPGDFLILHLNTIAARLLTVPIIIFIFPAMIFPVHRNISLI